MSFVQEKRVALVQSALLSNERLAECERLQKNANSELIARRCKRKRNNLQVDSHWGLN